MNNDTETVEYNLEPTANIQFEPTINVRILTAFAQVRGVAHRKTSSQVKEEINEKHIKVTTYRQHDHKGRLLVEDVVVESRPELELAPVAKTE